MAATVALHAVHDDRRAGLGGAGELDATGGFGRIDGVVAALDAGDRHLRDTVDGQRPRVGRGVAGGVGRQHVDREGAVLSGCGERHRPGAVGCNGGVDAVHDDRRAGLGGAGELDAAGGFGRIDGIVAALDAGDRNFSRGVGGAELNLLNLRNLQIERLELIFRIAGLDRS